MKLVEINSVCGVGSTGRICTDLATMLENQGHECKIIYGRGNVLEQYQKYAIRIGTNIDVNIHAGLSRILDKTGFYSKTTTKKIINWLKKYNPDVIHLHNIHGYYINIKELFNYLKTCNKKIIWPLHDCWSFTGHCSHFDYIKCDKWKTECFKCPQKKEYPKSILFDRSKRNYQDKKELFTGINNMIIVTPSYWLSNLVKESFLKEYKVEVIHNGIDLNVFKPTPSNFKEKYHLEDKYIVLGVANIWSNKKGLDDFIKLSNMLDNRFQIVLVGLNKEQLKIIPKKILGIERTNSVKELAEIYTASDVFVNLTYEDVYPTVNLEAQACNTPVITYYTGGSIESVSSSNIVKQGDIKGIKDMINNNTFNKNELIVVDKNEMLMKYLEIYNQ